MASNIYDWSTTAANNANSDGDLTWAEGQAPSTVNNSARVMMQRVKQLLLDLGASIAAGGTANGLTVTASSPFTALANGQIVAFRATANNSGAATLNVNGVGSKAIRKMDSTGDVALTANEIRSTGLYIAQYSEALNGGAGAWLLVNPTLSAAVYALSSLVTTDNALARYDGTAGKLQNSNIVLDDTGNATFSAADFSISADTTDASDNKSASLVGGGAAMVSRGAYLGVFGNEHASFPGQVRIFAGTGGSIRLAGDTTIVGAVVGTSFAGAGSGLTGLDAGNIATGTLGVGRLSGSYTGITGTGALNAGSITSGFGGIDIGSSAFSAGTIAGTTGTFSSSVSGTTITASTAYQAPDGSAAFPGIRFTSDTNTGIYRIGADTIGITTAGTLSATFTATSGLTVVSTLQADRFASSASTAIFGGDSAKTVALRPNGVTSTTNQMTYTTSGNLTAAGDITANSDIKLKKHIRSITGALDLVKQLRGVRFTRRKVNTKSIGFVAQEVETVFPELVHENETGKSVSYPNFVALLVEAVKELSAKVDRLESRK